MAGLVLFVHSTVIGMIPIPGKECEIWFKLLLSFPTFSCSLKNIYIYIYIWEWFFIFANIMSIANIFSVQGSTRWSNESLANTEVHMHSGDPTANMQGVYVVG